MKCDTKVIVRIRTSCIHLDRFFVEIYGFFDLAKALQAKLAAAKSPNAPKAYRNIHLNKIDLTHLESFLKQLDDVDDKAFRELILNAKILNTLLD